jgi:hypothetical protein
MIALAVAASPHAQTMELVMFERADCAWCRAWHRDIGPGYGKSAEGHLAPLRRVDLDGPWPADLPKLGIRYTPTFVLMLCGHESGRLIGYPGADFFYPKVEALLAESQKEGKSPGNCG